MLWLMLNKSTSAGQMIFGGVLGLLVPILTRGLRPLPVKMRSPGTALKLALRVVWDTSVSNFRVTMFLLFPKLRKKESAFLMIPLELKDPNGLAVLAMITCITPGSSWAEISRDRTKLLLHVLEGDNPQETIDHLKKHYEKPLMKIFEGR